MTTYEELIAEYKKTATNDLSSDALIDIYSAGKEAERRSVAAQKQFMDHGSLYKPDAAYQSSMSMFSNPQDMGFEPSFESSLGMAVSNYLSNEKNQDRAWARDLPLEAEQKISQKAAMVGIAKRKAAIWDAVTAANPAYEGEDEWVKDDDGLKHNAYWQRIMPAINKVESEMGLPLTPIDRYHPEKSWVESALDTGGRLLFSGSARIMGGAAVGVGNLPRLLGELGDIPSYKWAFGLETTEQEVSPGVKELGQWFVRLGDRLAAGGEDLQQAADEIDRWHPAFGFSKKEVENPMQSPQWWIANGGQFAGQLAEQVAAGAIGGTLAGPVGAAVGWMSVTIPLEYGEAYMEMRERGASREDAGKYAYAYALSSTAIETIPLSRFTKGVSKKGMANFFLNALSEGTTESMQEAALLAVTEFTPGTTPETWNNIFKRVGTAFTLGAVAGGALSFVMPRALPTPEELKAEAKKATDRAIKKAVEGKPAKPSKDAEAKQDAVSKAIEDLQGLSKGDTKEETGGTTQSEKKRRTRLRIDRQREVQRKKAARRAEQPEAEVDTEAETEIPDDFVVVESTPDYEVIANTRAGMVVEEEYAAADPSEYETEDGVDLEPTTPVEEYFPSQKFIAVAEEIENSEQLTELAEKKPESLEDIRTTKLAIMPYSQMAYELGRVTNKEAEADSFRPEDHFSKSELAFLEELRGAVKDVKPKPEPEPEYNSMEDEPGNRVGEEWAGGTRRIMRERIVDGRREFSVAEKRSDGTWPDGFWMIYPESELQKQIEFDNRRHEGELKRQAERERAERAEEEAKKRKMDLNGFMAGKSDISRQRAASVLDKQIIADKKVQTRREYVESLVKSGWKKSETKPWKKSIKAVVENPSIKDGNDLRGLNKTEGDYFDHLVSIGYGSESDASAKNNGQEPEPQESIAEEADRRQAEEPVNPAAGRPEPPESADYRLHRGLQRNTQRKANKPVSQIRSEFIEAYGKTEQGAIRKHSMSPDGKAEQAQIMFDEVMLPFARSVAERTGMSEEEVMNRIVHTSEAEPHGHYNATTRQRNSFRGYYGVSSGLLKFTAASDIDTMFHEFFHAGVGLLPSKDIDTLIDFASKQAGETIDERGNLTVKGEEILAITFSNYVMTGEAPASVKPILKKIKQFMLDFYRKMSGGMSKLDKDLRKRAAWRKRRSAGQLVETGAAKEITPEVKAVFDRLLTAERDAVHKETAPFEQSPEESHLFSALADEDMPAVRDQTKTPEFKAWFGDSKVVDENGQPLPVYHGTDRAGMFTEFDSSADHAGREAIFFTDSQTMAATYTSGRYTYQFPDKVESVEELAYSDQVEITYWITEDGSEPGWNDTFYESKEALLKDWEVEDQSEIGRMWSFFDATTGERLADITDPDEAVDFYNSNRGTLDTESGPGLLKVFLSMKDPLEVDAAGNNWNDIYGDDPDGGGFGTTTNTLAREAKDAGHDGVIIRNVADEGRYGRGYELGSTVYIVFEPTQIKSATDNSGAFDPNNPSILMDSITDDLVGVDKESMKEAQKGISSRTTLGDRLDNAKEWAAEHFLRNRWSKLPRTEQFGAAREILSKLNLAYNNAAAEVTKIIGGVTGGLSQSQMELFTLKVYHDDIQQDIDANKEVPFYEGTTPKERKAAYEQNKRHIDKKVAADPILQKAIDNRKKYWTFIRDDYLSSYKKLGIDKSKAMTNPDYFRHQVIEHVKGKDLADRIDSSGGSLKVKKNRGWLKERQGTSKAINLNYFQAEMEAMAQLRFDTKTAQAIDEIKLRYDKLPDLKAEAKASKVHWTDLDMPDGHVRYVIQPGEQLYTVYSVRESIANKIMAGSLGEVISGKDLKEVLAKGSPFDPIVIPRELANQLSDLKPPGIENNPIFENVARKPVRAWKQWALLSPFRIAKYTIRNLSEVDKFTAWAPQAWRHVPAAATELVKVAAGKQKPSADLQAWMEHGGMQAALTRSELGKQGGAENLADLERRIDRLNMGSVEKAARSPQDAWRLYWKAARKFTDLRESMLRYAAYKSFKADLDANGGKPSKKSYAPAYAASNPRDIDGAITNEYKAFKMANDLLGAYDDLTPIGHTLRDSLVPFWAFQEANLKAWYRGVANIIHDDASMHALGKKVLGVAARKSPYLAVRVGAAYALASAFNGLLQSWNEMMFPELEDDLPDEEKRRAHMIFGKDDDGNVLYFGRLGTLTDVQDWFGAPASKLGPIASIIDLGTEYANGRKDASDLFFDPVAKGYNAINPLYKGIFEALAGTSGFPDIKEPRKIRYLGDYFASMFGVREEYLSLSRSWLGQKVGLEPRAKPYSYWSGERLRNLFLYTSKEKAASYHHIRGEAYKFAQEELGYPKGYSESKRSTYLYEFKKAMRFGDKKAAEANLALYLEHGGTGQGFKQSMRMLHPLAPVPAQHRPAFLLSLSEEDRERLEDALLYFTQILGVDNSDDED